MGLFDFFKSKKTEETERQVEPIDTNISKCDELIDGISFGYKNAWFVFKSAETEKLKTELKKYLKYEKTVELLEGVKLGYDGYFALLRPISNFTILISSDGFRLLDSIIHLSKEIGEITFYATHRSNDFLMIAKYVDGICVRDFQVSGDDGVIKNLGTPTEIEIKVAEKEKSSRLDSNSVQNDTDLKNEIENSELLSFLGSEETLMEIAENWTINPTKLDQRKVNNCAEIYK